MFKEKLTEGTIIQQTISETKLTLHFRKAFGYLFSLRKGPIVVTVYKTNFLVVRYLSDIDTKSKFTVNLE